MYEGSGAPTLFVPGHRSGYTKRRRKQADFLGPELRSVLRRRATRSIYGFFLYNLEIYKVRLITSRRH